jgi:hypothetical protein
VAVLRVHLVPEGERHLYADRLGPLEDDRRTSRLGWLFRASRRMRTAATASTHWLLAMRGDDVVGRCDLDVDAAGAVLRDLRISEDESDREEVMRAVWIAAVEFCIETRLPAVRSNVTQQLVDEVRGPWLSTCETAAGPVVDGRASVNLRVPATMETLAESRRIAMVHTKQLVRSQPDGTGSAMQPSDLATAPTGSRQYWP